MKRLTGSNMKKTGYVVFLRGVNVGGKNIIKMDELKKIFEELKFTEVKTYIQSGNIIFNDYEKDKTKLVKNIDKKLYKKLNTKVNIAILTFPEFKEIIDKKPKGFGDADEKKYDVIYLTEPLKANDALKEIKTREGVDEIFKGKNVLYISRKKESLAKSYLSKIIETPVYQNITIRNWNTTKKIYDLMNL